MSTKKRNYIIDEVLTTSKLFLEIHNKYHFVLRCHSARHQRNFPAANLLEEALLCFDVAIRDYQREVPDEIRKCQEVDLEGYTLSVNEIKKQNSNPEEVKSFAIAQEKYFEDSQKRYTEEMRRRMR